MEAQGQLQQETQSKTRKQLGSQKAPLSLLWLQRPNSAWLLEKEKRQCQEFFYQRSAYTQLKHSPSAKKIIFYGIEDMLHIWLDHLPQLLMSG